MWFDAFAAVLVWWPASWTPWIALAALALVGVAIRRGRRTGALSLGGVAIGLASLVVTLLVAAVLGDALTRLLAIHTAGALFVPHVGPMLAAAWATGLTAALAVGKLARRWASFDAVAAGQAVGWLVIGLGLHAALPGAAYVAVVPGAVIAVAMLARSLARLPEPVVAVAGLVAASTVLLPFVLFGYDALGTPIVTGVAVMLGLIGATFAALLAATAGRLALAGLAATIVLAIAAMLAPATSASQLAHVGLAHITDADTGAARWQTAGPTPAVRALAPFVQAQVAPWLGRNGSAEVAPAPAFAIAPPTATIAPGAVQPDGTRTITLDVASARQAPRLALAWRSDAELVGLRVNGTPLPPRPARFRSALIAGWHRILIRGGSARIELTVRGAGPAEARLSDTSFGLPAIGAPLAAVRDASGAVTFQDGDVTVVERHLAW